MSRAVGAGANPELGTKAPRDGGIAFEPRSSGSTPHSCESGQSSASNRADGRGHDAGSWSSVYFVPVAPPSTEAEEDYLDRAEDLTPTSRLSCQAVVKAT